MPPQLARLTLRWLEAPDREVDIVTSKDLVKYLESAGNSQAQIDYWFDYSSNMSAVERETLTEVIETEAILAKMQEQIL
jgi:hypothetical protein